MASKFTNRLVGTVALVAVGVIVLPEFLDGNKRVYEEEYAVIPLAPNIDMSAVEAKQDAQRQAAAEAAAPVEAPASDTTNAPESDATAVHSDTIESVAELADEQPEYQAPQPLQGYADNAWVIQMGVFRNAVNVNSLVAKLKQAGYSAYTVPNTPVDGRPTKVYVGPNVKKERLEQQLDALQKLTGLKGRIYAYSPLDA